MVPLPSAVPPLSWGLFTCLKCSCLCCLLLPAAASAAGRCVLGSRHSELQGEWGGSVLDSVVGAFLTQAVSDVQSSTAFMNLAATWPGPAAAARQQQQEGGDAAGGSGLAGGAGAAAFDDCGDSGSLPPWYQRGAVGEQAGTAA